MISETIKYNDYDGNEREETFWFNLSKAECMEMELSADGGMEKLINKIISEQDNKKMVDIFKEIILRSYGEKSVDGKYFRKSPEISANFASTEAYSELFMRLATDADYASKFINGILPEMPKSIEKTSNFVNNVIPGR